MSWYTSKHGTNGNATQSVGCINREKPRTPPYTTPCHPPEAPMTLPDRRRTHILHTIGRPDQRLPRYVRSIPQDSTSYSVERATDKNRPKSIQKTNIYISEISEHYYCTSARGTRDDLRGAGERLREINLRGVFNREKRGGGGTKVTATRS